MLVRLSQQSHLKFTSHHVHAEVKQKHLCHAVVPFNLHKPSSCQRPHQVQEYRGGGGSMRRITDWQEELHIETLICIC